MATARKSTSNTLQNGTHGEDKVTKLKIYMLNNGIQQKEIHLWSGLSQATINKLVNTGIGNQSTKKLVATFLKMTDEQFEKLLMLVPKSKMYQKV